MGKALLVLDMQEVCVGKNHADFFKYDDTILDSVNQVINENIDNTVVYIRNVMKNNLISKLAPVKVYEGSKEVKLAKELDIVSDNVFDKFKGNAFSNTELAEFLKASEIDEIEVVGVDGGGCVSLTAIGAMQNGYKVIVNTKAVGTMFEKKRDSLFKKLEKMGAEFIR